MNMENTHRSLHSGLLGEVHEELLYLMNTYICDNDMCERLFHIDNAWIGHMWFSSNHDYYFCCEDCKSYGEWSLTYDYRKSMRRR